MFSQRGGGATDIGAAFEHLLCQTAVLLFPEREILSHLNYFPVPRVGNLTKKLLINSNAAPMPLPLPLQTLIPA